MTTTTSSSARLLIAMSAFAAFAVLASCDRDDPVAMTLASVEHELAAAHSGGASAAPPSMRQTIYTQAVSQLQSPAREGSDAQRDAANMLLAQAHVGIAQLESSQAAEMENRLLDRATRLRAKLDLYASQSALAEALGAIDPASERAALDQALADVDQRLSDAQRDRRDLQAEVDAFKAAADEASRAASERRAEAAQFRARALDAPATEAASLIERAYEIERTAAVSEREASQQIAAMEKIEPRLAEANRVISRLGDERASLTEARRRVDQRTQDARQQSQSARAEARAAADEAARALEDIETIRTGELAERWNQAIRHAQSAVSALSQSRAGDAGVRATNAILRGEAQQRLGDMHAAKARGVERYLLLLDNVADLESTVPFINRAREIIERAEAELIESGQAAADAYQQAAATFQGAGVRDQEISERLERLQRMLRQAAGKDAETAPGAAG